MRWLGILVAVILTACGGTAGTAVVASSPSSIEVGEGQRLLLALADSEAQLRGGPDLEVTVELTSPDGSTSTGDTRWVWAIPEVRGFYVAEATFDTPGRWQVVLDPADAPPTPPTPFDVVADSPMPGVGDPAPSSVTRTHPEHPLEEITTDPDPDPALYELTVAEAVSNGSPAVIVFATPAFCQTATCGPTLDTVKALAPDYPGIDVVHVEVFENLDAEDPGGLQPVEAVEEWGLQTEPWVFVVDPEGIISARFEGTVGPTELEEALGSVSGT